MKKMKLKLLSILILSTIILLGCEEKKDSKLINPATKRQGAENTLVVGTFESKGNFLPVYYATAYDANIVALVFRGLLDSKDDGTIIPGIAESWEVSEDKKTYTFVIKKDIKFSDGTPLTASDVEFSYKVVADPNYDGRFSSYAEEIVGYEKYHNDKEAKVKNIEGIKVFDDYNMSFTFKEPLVINLKLTGLAIMPKHYYNFKKGEIEKFKAKMQDLVGAGPFVLNKFVPKQYVELIPNKYYYKEQAKINRIIIKFVAEATKVQELIKGDIDILPGVIEPKNIDSAKKSNYLKINQYPRSGYGYLKFNCESEIVSDKKVRQALIYGLNRDAFIKLYFKEYAMIQNVPMSQVSWAYTPEMLGKINKYEYDEEKAKALLEEAGWKLGKDGIREKEGKRLTIEWASIKDHDLVLTLIPVITENWKKIGVELNIDFMDFNTLLDRIYKERKGFDMYNMATSLGSDPDIAYSGWHSKYDVEGGDNTSKFKNKLNDDLLDEGRREFDQEKRKKIYEEWAININEEAPLIILYTNMYADLYNERVKNLNTSSLKDWTDNIMEIELVDEVTKELN